MQITLLLTTYCVLLAATSILGGWLPSVLQLTHLRTQLAISFVAGLMLAIATYQLLPHAIELLESPGLTGGMVLGGILVMFLMLRMFHAHTHAGSPLRVDADEVRVEHDHGETEHHHAPGEHCHSCHVPEARGIGWVGMMVGLSLHSIVDGIALAASVAADAQHGAWLGLFGLGTMIAVALHKPLDAFAITSTMQASGWSSRHCKWVNMAFSIISPLGVLLFWLGVSQVGMPQWTIGLGLAVSAGFFICIALADLLPEVHFHSHDRFALTITLFFGITVAIILENLSGHQHSHSVPAPLPEPPQKAAAIQMPLPATAETSPN